jgi:hypothetical protein
MGMKSRRSAHEVGRGRSAADQLGRLVETFAQ